MAIEYFATNKKYIYIYIKNIKKQEVESIMTYAVGYPHGQGAGLGFGSQFLILNLQECSTD